VSDSRHERFPWAAAIIEKGDAVDVIVDRCAGLDVHQKTVMAAVRTPGEGGCRREVLTEYRTFTGDLARLREALVAEGVTQVAMEATGVYWKPVWHALWDAGFELLLVNPRHVKNVPGRKTDACDASWLAQLLECGLLRGSFVPPPAIARLRDLTRYRTTLVAERGREIQRLQKLLEDAGIKVASVATDVMGVSARNMIEALIDGERDPVVLAELARTSMRAKIPVLREALVGRFDDHHGLLARMHLDHIDDLAAMVARLDEEVETLMGPFSEAATRLLTIPGVGKTVAEIVVAEVGADMSRFPTAAHLASWAGLCPGNHESAGKRRSGKTTRGNKHLRRALSEAAWAASHTNDTYLAARYRRFLRTFGKRGGNKAIVALAHTLIVIIWHILASDDAVYADLGADFFEQRRDDTNRRRYLVAELEKMGLRVALEPAA
jgi:transposase